MRGRIARGAGCVAPTNNLIWAAAAKIGTVAGKQRHG
jgi:hypothetical protein